MTAFVKSTGKVKHNSATTLTLPFGSAPAATGNTIIVRVGVNDTGLTNSSFTDNQGGTYVIDKTDNNAGGVAGYIARRTDALSTGSTVTVTVTSASSVFWTGEASEYSGVSTNNVQTASSGSGTSSPFTATLGSVLNSGELAVSLAVADDNTATQGISDPPTGGTATWTTRVAEQDTSTSTAIVGADLISAGGSADAATWATNTTTGRVGIIVGYKASASAPTITDVNTTEIVKAGDTGINFTGTNLGANTGARTIDIVQGAVAVAQTQTAGDSTTGTVNIVTEPGGAAIKFGSASFRATVSGQSGSIALTVNPATGELYTDLGTPNTTAANRITAVGDLVSGDQLHARSPGGGAAPAGLTLNNDATFYFTSGNTPVAFEVRAWDQSDATWGAFALQLPDTVNLGLVEGVTRQVASGWV
jgi:hypothetical protein